MSTLRHSGYTGKEGPSRPIAALLREIRHNPLQPHDNHGREVFGPGEHGGCVVDD